MEKRTEFLPYSRPYIDDDEIDVVVDVLRSGWWTRGAVTTEFEKRIAEYVGAKYALALSSCTAASHLALYCHGIGAGDEVITTPMTFCSTANTIVEVGATPVFADINCRTGLIDPEQIEAKITPRTKAIVPVHYAGQSCDMDAIEDIARRHGLVIIEDAAHALSTTYKGKRVGSSGNATCFSFYATKNISTAEGGMLTSDDADFIEHARIMSLHGMSKNAWSRYGKGGTWKYEVVASGYKYNTTDIASSLGLAQMNKLDEMQQIRGQYYKMYCDLLRDVDGVSLLEPVSYGQSSYHLCVLCLDTDKLSIDRDRFIELLTNEYNIGISVHFIPLPMHPFYIERFGENIDNYPQCKRMYESIISLPLYPSMKPEDVEYVAAAVREISTKYAK
ncbi:MAG: DegT/DnrJ/EryC1/StrS family aminotransferase [Firmicutes bacterium]|nr:DegT/DnrJ/EryC1/StrS family aminotransferase [Bacillota bacterium]